MGKATSAAVLAMALLLTACSQADGRLDTSGEQGANDINAQPADRIKDGGTVQWPVSRMPTNWNYYYTDTDSDTATVLNPMYPWLFTETAKAEVVLNRDYLDAAAVVSNDPQVVQYDLNPKATWSNGRPIDWTDFKALWGALNGKTAAFQAAVPGYDAITDVAQGSNPRQVKVTFGRAYGEWKSLFSPLTPREINADPNTFNTAWANTPQITAGPFTIGPIDPTAKTAKVVRDPKWWGAKAHLDTILFKQLAGTTLPDAMASGAIDVADTAASVDAVKRYRSMPGVTLHQAVATDSSHLTFNGAAGKILADQKLRTILTEAIDRQAIADAAIGQVTPNPPLLDNHFYAIGSSRYRDNSGGLKFDLAKAKTELDAAGWRLAGQYRAKDGKELDLTYLESNSPASTAIGQLVQQQLTALGVKVTLNTVPQTDYFSKYVFVGNFDITNFRWRAGTFPLSSSTPKYTVDLKDPTNLLNNFGAVGDQEINDDFDRALAALDDNRRAELTQQIDVKLWRLAGELPLFQVPQAVATRSTIANYGAVGFAGNPIDYAAIGFMK
jgi:peptide/nickel transport system substrate-binding protein